MKNKDIEVTAIPVTKSRGMKAIMKYSGGNINKKPTGRNHFHLASDDFPIIKYGVKKSKRVAVGKAI